MYIDGIFIAYRWNVNGIILSYRIIIFILQLTDGTIQTHDHTLGFVGEVAVIWHVNITKTIVFRIRFSPNAYRIVYQNRTYMV